MKGMMKQRLQEIIMKLQEAMSYCDGEGMEKDDMEEGMEENNPVKSNLEAELMKTMR